MKTQVINRTDQAPLRPFAHTRFRVCSSTALAGAVLSFLLHFSAQAHQAEYEAAVTSEPSLISYYTFEASDATDAHGTNNGTLVGTTAFAPGPRDGTALSLDGNGWVNLGYVEDFTFTNDESGSVEAWLQAGNLGGNGCIAAARWNFDNSPWQVNLTTDKEAVGMWNGVSYTTLPVPNASTNWHHLVVVFENGLFTVYWDGALADSTFQILGFATDPVPTQIGSPFPYGGGQENWIGRLDEVALYADPLTPEAVQAHYDAMFIGDPPVITRQPKGGTYLAGVPLTLSVEATAPPGQALTYQWHKGATVLGGETNTTLSFPSLGTGDVGTYWVTVSNMSVGVNSSNAIVELGSLPARLVDYQTAVSNEASLISYYTFDHLLPEDVHGPNDGTLAGATYWGGGIGGGAAQGLLLDGAGHVDLGSVAAFDFASGQGTVEGWIRADWVANSAGYWPCMYANRDSGTVWELQLSDAKKTPSFYNGSGSSWFNFPGYAETSWHHFATVFTNGTASFYVDGELIPYSPMSRPLGGGPGTVQLGSASPGTTASGWIGMLDEVAFYSTALPAASIRAHYNAYVKTDLPVITSQPVGGNYVVGQLAELSVGASGAQRTYQWYKDAVLMPGVTNAIIGPLGMTKDFSGDYHVIVSNPYGSATSEVATIYVGNNMANYQATVLAESSLISYYTFDDGTPQDSKNVHPGTNANTVAYAATGPAGVTNVSLSLAGNGHIDLGYVPDFDFADGTGTVEAWIRAGWTNGTAGYNPTIFSDRLGDASAWSVHVDQWKYQIGNYKTAPWDIQWLPIGLDFNWHHYAIVFSSNTVSMYLDGKPRGTFNQPLNSGADKPTQIGSAGPTTTSQGWIGGLDEVAFYSDALDADTIWSHYSAMASPGTLPSLSYTREGTQLTLFWPPDVTGFTLESADTLPAVSWTPVGGVVSNSVTVDASVGTRFYRLSQ